MTGTIFSGAGWSLPGSCALRLAGLLRLPRLLPLAPLCSGCLTLTRCLAGPLAALALADPLALAALTMTALIPTALPLTVSALTVRGPRGVCRRGHLVLAVTLSARPGTTLDRAEPRRGDRPISTRSAGRAGRSHSPELDAPLEPVEAGGVALLTHRPGQQHPGADEL